MIRKVDDSNVNKMRVGAVAVLSACERDWSIFREFIQTGAELLSNTQVRRKTASYESHHVGLF